MAIRKRPVVIDEAVLDLIGKQFKFDHAKGIAEWFKNSVDAYIRKNIPNKDQIIILRLYYSKNKKLNRIEVIDFVGMTYEEIENAFIRFFDPLASKFGAKDLNIKTLGGHGNGGKFYMRQMFKTSRIITYRNKKMNIFGFDKNKNYGYEENFENVDMEFTEALRTANIIKLELPTKIMEKLASNRTGFTVVRGDYPVKAASSEKLEKLLDKIRINPQSKRIIERNQIYLALNDESTIFPLKSKKTKPKKGFEQPQIIPIPQKIKMGADRIIFSKSESEHIGELKLFTSEDPLIGFMSELNSIDFIGNLGVIASYKLHELGRFAFQNQIEFIYGECIIPILEEDEYDSIQNDRQKFIDTPYSKAILYWVRERVEELAEKLEISAKKEKKKKRLNDTSAFNSLLNIWKNKFMEKQFSELMKQSGEGDFPIYNYGNSDIVKPKIEQAEDRNKKNGQARPTSIGNGKKKRRLKFPMVLISGKDPDPFDDSDLPFECDARHPAVYQRKIDVENGIYWINTSKPLAEVILENYGENSAKWRDYLFQRYIDIIIKETFKQLRSMEPTFTYEDISMHLDRIVSEILDMAYEDLIDFLLDDNYKI